MDETKIYTAVNADELEEGDVVVVADTWAGLQRRVREGDVAVITDIEPSTNIYRFTIEGGHSFALAYLIAKHDDPYKEFKKAQAERKKVWFRYDNGHWHLARYCDFTEPVDRYSLTDPTSTKEYKVFLDGHFVYTNREVPEGKHVYYISSDSRAASKWCVEHNKFAEIARAWEEGATIEYRIPQISNIWSTVTKISWRTDAEYRVKPTGLKWTDLKVGDVISNGRFLSLVVCIDQGETDSHIQAGSTWLTDDELENWRKV